MVTGEKLDEQVDWSEVVQIATPLRDLIDELSVALFGLRPRDFPAWMDELFELEKRGRLPKRYRKRRASLLRRLRAQCRRAARVQQRRMIGVRS